MGCCLIASLEQFLFAGKIQVESALADSEPFGYIVHCGLMVSFLREGSKGSLYYAGPGFILVLWYDLWQAFAFGRERASVFKMTRELKY